MRLRIDGVADLATDGVAQPAAARFGAPTTAVVTSRVPARRRRPRANARNDCAITNAPDQAERLARPLLRRRPIRPDRRAVRIRRRNPWVFFRFRLFGWNVLFTHGLLERPGPREGGGPRGGRAARRYRGSWRSLARARDMQSVRRPTDSPAIHPISSRRAFVALWCWACTGCRGSLLRCPQPR